MKKPQKLNLMKIKLFIILLAILIVTACKSNVKNSDSVENEKSGSIENDTIFEVTPIDDSGEALADDTLKVTIENEEE